MKTHNLKTLPEFYFAIKRGSKTFEVRENDRDYKVGDILVLHYFNPELEEQIEETITVLVSYIFYGGKYGLAKNYCVMSVKRI